MTLPGVTVTIRDPGLVRGGPSSQTALVYGTSSSGTANVVKLYSSPSAIVDEYTDGPLVEAALRTIKEGGRPVAICRSDSSVAAANGTVSQTGGGPLPTLSGSATRRIDVILEILAGGTVGTATFRFSLDNGLTWSAARDTAASYALPGTGVTVTFTAGTYVAAERYTFTSRPAFYNATDISALQTAILATGRRFTFLHLAGTGAASDMVTLFAAVASMMTALENQFQYKRAIMSADADTDTDDATILTAWSAAISTRIAIMHSWAWLPSEIALEGGAFWKAPTAHVTAARQAGYLLSTDQARTDDPVTDIPTGEDGAPLMGHDEFTNEAGYDDAQIGTLRTWPDRPGVFVSNLRLKSGPSSDFQYFQDGIIMDRACEIILSGLIDQVGRNIRTNPDNVPNDGDTGTIFEPDAQDIEGYINNKLAADLLRPQNADGYPGHVTALAYQIDRSYDAAANEGIQGDGLLVKLTSLKQLAFQIGFVRSIS